MKDIDPQPDMLDNKQDNKQDNTGITDLLGELECLMAVLDPAQQAPGDDLIDHLEDTSDTRA